MIIDVFVQFKKNKNPVEENKKGEYVVFVKAEPEKGKANREVVKKIAKYFKKAEEQVKIISGKKSRKKKLLIDKN